MSSDSEENISFNCKSFEEFKLNSNNQVRLIVYIIDSIKNIEPDSLYIENRTLERILLHEEITYIDFSLVEPYRDPDNFKDDAKKYIKKLESINSSLKISFLNLEYDDSNKNADLNILFEYKDIMIQLELIFYDEYHEQELKTEEIDYLIKYIKDPNQSFDKSKLEHRYDSVEKVVDKILNKKYELPDHKLDIEEDKFHLLILYLDYLRGFRSNKKCFMKYVELVEKNIEKFNLSPIYKYNLSKFNINY